MAAVASQPPWHPYKFGQHPRPEASPEPFIPPRPINFPGSRANHAPADRFPSPERPFYASNDSSEFDRAAFGQYPESGHRPAYPPPNRPDPPPDRPDPPLTRNKHVTFSTPSGGYYTTNTSPTNPTLQNGDPHRSGSVWSRISDRFRGVSRAMEARPDNPTIPQSSGLNREQQIQQVLALLLPYVPAAEPMIRPMINLIHDSQLLQQLIDTLNRPLTQQQFLEIQDSFTIPADEQAEFVKMLSNPDDPGIPTLLAQFKEFVEYISGRPIPSTSGASSRVCRMIPSFLRNSLRCLQRKCSQSTNIHTIPTTCVQTPAESSTKQPSEAKKFYIHELLRSRFKGFVVEPFTCTGCETNIPAVSRVSARLSTKY
ncbi:hypothetical protein J132_01482 [Termitomyces sp. J132]|nr:hypothetical protein J132_01482 [Termitomyces sp. J132]